ncbi:sigma-70 family RNA polymerase sigma factor [Alkalinema pantanalense CENA528]|uniref:sigma-70 family RNA polymerase sigma factor n=1 Tax=Alkalinema pantanalense TaxID=1620705 RepID=UPI003D6FDDBF
MPIQSRKDLIASFSSFLQFQSDRTAGWVVDARLRRSMQTQTAQETAQQTAQEAAQARSEDFWAIYWHRAWQTSQTATNPVLRQQLALGHLSAYLQETCYWSVHRTMPQVSSSQVSFSDCFQGVIAEVPRLLRAFDSSQRPSLKTYANTAFCNILRSNLRQQREIDLCSEWSLLLKLSRRLLAETLEQAGLSSTQQQEYLLAWTCFMAAYPPSRNPQGRTSAGPDAETWATIAAQYNQQASQPVNPSAPELTTDVTAEMLETWLKQMANQVRRYLYPATQSLNVAAGDGEEDWQVDLPDVQRESPLGELISQEEADDRKAQLAAMEQFLQGAIGQLDELGQQLLKLYYQDNLTQQQMAKILGIQQYTVSRKLAKTRENLLLALSRWSQETLHISLSSTVVKSISTLLEDWLQSRYRSSS